MQRIYFVLKGFRFGMLLQLSIGPVCLLVFQTSGTLGLSDGFILVPAVTLVDSAYIALAEFGAASAFKHRNVQKVVCIFGCIVLVLFGVETIIGTLGKSFLPSISLFSKASALSLFLQGILLTASNPLTILFWGGVFSAKAADLDFNRKSLVLFGIGCVLSTAIFLSVIAILGSFVHHFFPSQVIKALNISVGCLLVGFGIRLLMKRSEKPDGS